MKQIDNSITKSMEKVSKECVKPEIELVEMDSENLLVLK